MNEDIIAAFFKQKPSSFEALNSALTSRRHLLKVSPPRTTSPGTGNFTRKKNPRQKNPRQKEKRVRGNETRKAWRRRVVVKKRGSWRRQRRRLGGGGVVVVATDARLALPGAFDSA